MKKCGKTKCQICNFVVETQKFEHNRHTNRINSLCLGLKPWVWFKHLDDIFLVWLHREESLLQFLNYANSYHATIKYTWGWSYSRLSYLDVMVKVKDTRLDTDVFSKPTDTHQYLEYGSCHPKHVKRAIPYGQALRLKRICRKRGKT